MELFFWLNDILRQLYKEQCVDSANTTTQSQWLFNNVYIK